MRILDTNILIYSGEPMYAQLLVPFVTDPRNFISAISIVETLGFHRITPPQVLYFESLLKVLQVVPVDDTVIWKATQLRQSTKMSLGDALIAATALLQNVELITRNLHDFASIRGLVVHNPIP